MKVRKVPFNQEMFDSLMAMLQWGRTREGAEGNALLMSS